METTDFFRSRIDTMIKLRHPLAVLATRSRLDPQTKQRRLDAKYASSSKEFVDGAEPAEGCRSRI